MTPRSTKNANRDESSLRNFLVCCLAWGILSVGFFANGQITYAQIKQFAKVENQLTNLSSTDSLLAIKLNSHLFEVFREMQSKKIIKQPSIMFQQYRKDVLLQITQDGFVQVEIGVPRIESAFQQKLEIVGFKTEYSNGKFHRYFGRLPLHAIPEVAKLEFVNFIRAVERPISNEVITEGDVQHRAAYSRNLWGITGEDVPNLVDRRKFLK